MHYHSNSTIELARTRKLHDSSTIIAYKVIKNCQYAFKYTVDDNVRNSCINSDYI